MQSTCGISFQVGNGMHIKQFPPLFVLGQVELEEKIWMLLFRATGVLVGTHAVTVVSTL